jgi:hypothetical protein
LFGRDVIFPFGPLGYLLVPLDVGSNLGKAIALWLVVHTLFALGIGLALRREAGFIQVAAFAGSYLFANALELVYEYQLLAVIGLWLGISLSARSKLSAALPVVVAGTMTSFCLLAKLNLGLSAVAMLGTAELLRSTSSGSRQYSISLLTLGVFAGTTLCSIAVFFGSLTNFAEWLGGSFELAAGFGAAMGLRGPSTGLLCGGAALVVYLTATLAPSERSSLAARVGFLFCIPVLLSFRHGFVRHDVHVRNFFPFVLAALAIQLLFCRGRRETALVAASAILVAALALLSYSTVHLVDVSQMARVVFGLHGAENIQTLTTLERTREALGVESEVNLASKRLPASWLDAIRDSGQSINAFPWELSYAPANDLPLDPNPLLQSYHAYTEALDQRSADGYSDPDAPGFVVFEFKSIDGRHPLLDAPATTRELLRRYSLIDDRQSRGSILFGRVEPKFSNSLSDAGQVVGHIGEWIQLPSSEGLLFAELDIVPTLRRRISLAVFSAPPLNIQLEYADAERRTYRLTLATARNGLLMNRLPRSLGETASLFRGAARSPVVRFRIVGSGASGVQPAFDVRWKRADLEFNE